MPNPDLERPVREWPWIALGFLVGLWLWLPVGTIPVTLIKLTIFSITAFIGLLECIRRPYGVSGVFSSTIGRWWLAYAVVLLLSVTWSVAPLLSIVGDAPYFEGLLTQAMCAAWFFIGISLSRSEDGKRSFVTCITAADAGIICIALLQRVGFFGEPALFLGRTAGTLEHPLALGLWLVLTLPIVASEVFASREYFRPAGICLILGNLAVLLLTGSRGAIVAVLVQVAIFLRQKFRAGKDRRLLAAGFLTVIGCVALLLFPLLRHRDDLARSNASRMIITRAAAHLIADRPLGYGLETTGLITGSVLSANILQAESLVVRVDRAHSQPLDLLLTIGIGGLVMLYGFLFTLLAALWRQRHTAFFLSLLGGSIALLFGFETIPTAITFWLICGAAFGSVQPVAPLQNKRERLLLIALAAMVAGLIVLCLFRMQAWYSIDQSETPGLTTDRTLFVEQIERQLHGLETSPAAVPLSRAKMEGDLHRLDLLTNGNDGMALLLRAWWQAINHQPKTVGAVLAEAQTHSPGIVPLLRIEMHVYGLLHEMGSVTAAHTALVNVLPPDWRDTSTDRGRILWQENPWLAEL